MRGQSLPQWRAFLNSTLAKWGAAEPPLLDALYEMYLADAELDAQRAYDSINADYGTACAFARIGANSKRAGAGGKRASPVYIYRNMWQPSVPIRGSPSFNMTWAFHTWDYRAALEDWPSPADATAPFPGPTDVALARFTQGMLAQLFRTGRLDPAQTAGWDSVEAVPGFDSGSYGMMRISSDALPPFEPLLFEVDGKAAACSLLARFGFDEKYWWVN